MILRLDDPATIAKCPHYWSDASPDLQQHVIIGYDSRSGESVQYTCSEFMSTALHRTHSLLIYGAPEMCKSQALHQMGKTFAVRKQRDFYFFGKSIDPCGILSRWGILQLAGCVCFTDMNFTTQRGEGLIGHRKATP
jgi:hypothetical protein